MNLIWSGTVRTYTCMLVDTLWGTLWPCENGSNWSLWKWMFCHHTVSFLSFVVFFFWVQGKYFHYLIGFFEFYNLLGYSRPVDKFRCKISLRLQQGRTFYEYGFYCLVWWSNSVPLPLHCPGHRPIAPDWSGSCLQW